VGSLLRILKCIPNTSLSKIAGLWGSKIDSGNDVNLYVTDFNILFSAIVETKGATVGRTIWELFCEDPRAKFDQNHIGLGGYFIPRWIEDEENELEHGPFLRKKDDLPKAVDRHHFLPIVEMDDPVLDKLGEAAAGPLTSDSNYNEAEEEQALPMPDERVDPTATSNSTLDELEPATSDTEFLDPSVASGPATNPVVTPNLRTLRFLVRGALHERRIRQSRGEDTSMQNEILEWSKPFFRAFGIRGKALQDEVQIFTEEGDGSEDIKPNLAEEKGFYHAERRKSRLRESPPVDISRFFMSKKLGCKAIHNTSETKVGVLVCPVEIRAKQGEDELEKVQTDLSLENM
jgi:hypothetical protein